MPENISSPDSYWRIKLGQSCLRDKGGASRWPRGVFNIHMLNMHNKLTKTNRCELPAPDTTSNQARRQGGARGASAPPPPKGPKGPHFGNRKKVRMQILKIENSIIIVI